MTDQPSVIGKLPAASQRHKRLPLRYGLAVSRDIFLYTLLALAAVEAIYLSDKVITNLLQVTLQRQAGVGALALLTALAAPEVLFITLPTGLLIATYFVMLRRREAREFLIYSGFGYSTFLLVVLCMLIGIAGLAVSLAATGYIEPTARQAFGRLSFDLQYKAMREGRIAPGRFYEFGDYTVFAPPNREAGSLFIHQRLDDERYRIVIADRTQLVGQALTGSLGLIFENARAHEFLRLRDREGFAERGEPDPCPECRNAHPAMPISIVEINRLYGELPTRDLPSFISGAEEPGLMTTGELTRAVHTTPVLAEIAGRLLRGFLCFIAPLLGLLAFALTRPATLLFALPAATAAILCGGFFGGHVLKGLAPYGAATTFGVLLVVMVLATGLIIYAIHREQGGCVRPERLRL
ncbi:MAG: LptF/LptG family permease [Rhodobiaceae bacterium]|nr:LptF/LptG family permease [Rhodobiaceae bacterium]MCC0054634.1 LptF/LptG family permease [Rhodobiaceae bacterium]